MLLLSYQKRKRNEGEERKKIREFGGSGGY